MHTMHIEHLGTFVRSKSGNCYLIVGVDAFMKFVFFKAVANTKALLVERFIDEKAGVFGYPERIISDFTSKSFTNYCGTLGVKHVLTAVATPGTNGQVERYKKTILDALASSLTSDETDWDREVNKVKW